MLERRVHQLSARQREILLWSCRGKTYAEIGAILGLRNSTIKYYLDAARHKLNVVNLPHACAFAVVSGVFTHDEILNWHFEAGGANVDERLT